MSNADHGAILLKLARDAIAERYGAPSSPPPHEPWLAEPGATFVSLMQNGRVRGCIGSVQALQPLLEDVQQNASAAAFRDPRFEPLREDEFSCTQVEVSLISSMHRIIFDSEHSALSQIRPGVDGVVFEYAHFRSTFLPKVWEQLPTVEAFMTQLKIKAGLPGDFWAPQVKLSPFTVQRWQEAT